MMFLQNCDLPWHAPENQVVCLVLEVVEDLGIPLTVVSLTSRGDPRRSSASDILDVEIAAGKHQNSSSK